MKKLSNTKTKSKKDVACKKVSTSFKTKRWQIDDGLYVYVSTKDQVSLVCLCTISLRNYTTTKIQMCYCFLAGFFIVKSFFLFKGFGDIAKTSVHITLFNKMIN